MIRFFCRVSAVSFTSKAAIPQIELPVRFASRRVAPSRFALLQSIPARSVSLRFASLRFCSLKFTPLKACR
jgi:hypothetical protein